MAAFIMCMEQLIRIGNALLPPVIAVVATYIAWQQWKTNRQRLAMDKYERRLRVYEEVQRILRAIAASLKPTIDDLVKFRASVSEADFLFGPEIAAYIDEIFEHGLKLENWNAQYRDHTQTTPLGYDHKGVVEGTSRESKWLAHQFGPAKEKFRKYLDISG